MVAALRSDTVDLALVRLGREKAQQYQERTVPPEERELFAQSVTLRQLYTDWMRPLRKDRVAGGTLQKDLQALSYFETATRPDDWPADRDWNGLPIGFLTTGYIENEFLASMRRTHSDATVRSAWNHLRTILNFAVKVRAIEAPPRPESIPLPEKAVPMFDVDCGPNAMLSRGYRALDSDVELQVAFVVAANVGCRAVDLFSLRWSMIDFGERPTVTYRARKTKKLQSVPLCDVTARQLRRLLPEPTLVEFDETQTVFPRSSSPEAKEPEKTRPARRRNRKVKRLLAAAGIEFDKPWQALRVCCNERLEATQQGVGQFVLGHALTLNSRSYRQPSEIVRKTIEDLRQPAAFCEF